jgi:hypothetical protein
MDNRRFAQNSLRLFINVQMKFIFQIRPVVPAGASHFGIWLVGLALLAPLTGCGRDDIQVYRVPKEAASVQAQGGAARPPDGWEAVPPGEMRVASFRVKGKDGKTADVSVIPLPGLAGHDIDNVNRWRGQLGLAPVTEGELPKLAEPVRIGGLDGQLYDLAGENAAAGEKTRILAAMLRREGAAWFFKMTGDSELVAQQKPAFVSYLKSFSFPSTDGQTETSPATELPASHPPIGGVAPFAANQAGSQLPPSHPPIAGASAPAAGPVSSEGKPDWQVPASWKEIAGGQFLVAKFIITGSDSSQAAVNVSSSGGAGGGLAMNVNRWRGQLGLGQLAESEIQSTAKPLDVTSGKATLVDMIGADPKTGQKTRVLGVMVPQGQQTWFYKLMGPEQTVEANKEAFLSFVKTVKYR